MGLFHEQVRPDRDTYVSVNAANIQASAIGNYDIQPSTIVTTLGVPYDYGSIMHYSDKVIGRLIKPVIPVGFSLRKGE